MKRNVKRILCITGIVMAFLMAATLVSSACTTIYVGGARNDQGTPFVARTEDYGSDMNKMWFISEAGAFKQDSVYTGCSAYGGFQWKWTHDTYRFTYFTNDYLYNGVCPECEEGTAENPSTHFSYTEFGTNEKGVSVSATETIGGNQKVTATDPFRNSRWLNNNPGGSPGIEETDIPTIILGEAATAKEGLELLMNIYDTSGAWGASGLFISDQNETYYIENCSGTQYVALKLTEDLIFIEPNMAVIGKVDLDDENVIASENLISNAIAAESFVGDDAANIIDFRASYSSGIDKVDNRMVQGLNYLNAGYNYDNEALVADNTAFTISNVKDNAIVPIYTNIEADHMLTTEDILGFYHLSTVGKPSNQEIEIFQLFKDRPLEYGTVGWVGVGDMSYGVFVPCYPMLLDGMYEGYQVPAATYERKTERPDDAFCTFRSSRWGGDYFAQYPENWEDSYYFSFEGLGGLIASSEKLIDIALPDEAIAELQAQRDLIQKQLIEGFVSYDTLKEAADPRAVATANMDELASDAHAYALDAIDYVLEISDVAKTIEALPAADALKAADAEDVKDAKEAYDELSDGQKKAVGDANANKIALSSAVIAKIEAEAALDKATEAKSGDVKKYEAKIKNLNAQIAIMKKTVKKVKAKAKKKSAAVSWKSLGKGFTYEVYKATSPTKTFKKAATSKKTKATVKKLKKGKTYYFKVRAYKKVAGKKVYTGYSNIVKVKIKK